MARSARWYSCSTGTTNRSHRHRPDACERSRFHQRSHPPRREPGVRPGYCRRRYTVNFFAAPRTMSASASSQALKAAVPAGRRRRCSTTSSSTINCCRQKISTSSTARRNADTANVAGFNDDNYLLDLKNPWHQRKIKTAMVSTASAAAGPARPFRKSTRAAQRHCSSEHGNICPGRRYAPWSQCAGDVRH